MKSHLEVAKDAVRQAGLEELADALEWAAAAVKHRSTLLSAARWSATEGGACPDCGHAFVHDRQCPTAATLHTLDPEWSREEVDSCDSGSFRWWPEGWAPIRREPIIHRAGPKPALAPLGPIETPTLREARIRRERAQQAQVLLEEADLVNDAYDRMALAAARRPMPALGGNRIPPRPPFEGQPGLEAAVRAATTPEEARAIVEEHYRRERLHVDPARLEWTAPIIPSQLVTFGPPRVRPDGDVLMGMMQVDVSPQPAQPQPEDDVTPPASPPPAR